MLFAPINSFSGFFQRSQGQMADLRRTAERLQEQVSTGERLERSSDDPVAAARLRALSRDEALSAVHKANAARASQELSAASSRLDEIANAIIRARELAVQAGSDTTSATGRIAIADELAQLRQTILASANARGFDGRALFGGQTTGDAYVLDGAGNAIYAGTASSTELEIARGASVERSITGPSALAFSDATGPTDIFAFLAQLETALRGGVADPAAAARSAQVGFDNALDAVSRAQSVIGARAAWVEVVEQSHLERDEQRAVAQEHAGGIDLAATISRLQQTFTVLEASQASFARLSALSLFKQI